MITLFKRSLSIGAVLIFAMFSQTAAAQTADISVSLSGPAGPVVAGSGAGNVVITGTITNNGPSDTNGVIAATFTLPDPLPAGVFVDSVDVSLGAFDPVTTLWTVGALANGASETITATFTIAANAPQTADCAPDTFAECLVTILGFAFQDAPVTDPNETNNTAFNVTTFTREADLAVALIESTDPVVAGSGPGNLIYVGSVTNNGPSDASGVVNVTSTVFPAGVTVDEVNVSQGSFDPGTGIWTTGDILSGANAIVQVIYTVASNAPAGVDNISATITASANETDIIPENNSATVTTSIARSADLGVSFTESIDPVIAGSGAGNLVYIGTVTNSGISDASGIVNVTAATVPAGVTLDSVVPTQGSFDPGTGIWTVGEVAVGGFATITVTFTVAAAAAAGVDVVGVDMSTSSNEPDPDTANNSASIRTSIVREVDIEMAASDAPDPVVAGSGANNLVHVLTATNNGPSDASGVSVALVPTLPTGVTVVSIVPSVGSYTGGTWTVGNLAAGANATLTINLTVALTAAEGTDVISAQGTATSTETDTDPTNNVAVDPTSVRWPTATFRVGKEYTGSSGPAVDMELSCSDTSGLLVYAPKTGTALTSLTVRRFDIDPAGNGTSCTIIETVPGGYYEVARTADCDVDPTADQGAYECTITNAETRATVRVTKDFTDGNNPTEVEVSIDCNTGLILDQDKNIVEGPANYVEFVVTSFTDGALDCHVVEDTDALPGYIASYEAGVIFQQGDDDVGFTDDADGCHFTGIPGGAELSCAVTNDARPQPVVITKEWVFEGSINPGDIDLGYTLTLYCDDEVIEDGDYYCHGGNQPASEIGESLYSCKSFYGEGEDDFTAMVVPTYPGNSCYVTEDANTDYVESDASDCANLSVSAVAGGDSCTVTNLVFFEGIPTLSQYGMALMALLMLGMGMVGFRRYV